MGKPGTNEQQDQGAAYYYGGEGVALGDDTLTLVETTGKIVDHGHVNTAKININVTAAAEGESPYASADIDVKSLKESFDISHLKIKESSFQCDGVTYDILDAKFKGVDLPNHVSRPGGRDHKEIVIERDGDADLDLNLDGNVAMVTFDVEVFGDNTLANADAYALAIEDMLSESTFYIEAAVG